LISIDLPDLPDVGTTDETPVEGGFFKPASPEGEELG